MEKGKYVFAKFSPYMTEEKSMSDTTCYLALFLTLPLRA